MHVRKAVTVLILTIALMIPSVLRAEEEVKAKSPIDIYGFVATQFMWSSAETQLYGGINSIAAQSRVTDKTTVTPDDAYFGVTPQNSRLGFKLKPVKYDNGYVFTGLLEMDFVNIVQNGATTSSFYGTSPLPRLRHFYMDLARDNWALLVGQTWDLFSPLNTKSLSLGNNVWFQGNMGFRRPQLRFTYKFLNDGTNMLNAAVSIDHPANTDDMIANGGIDSGYPYGEMLVMYDRAMENGKLILAVSGAAGVNRTAGKNAKTYGFAGSIAIPFFKQLQISSEIHYGQNMGNFLSYAGATADATNLAVWGQLSSEWVKWFETNLGYGIDNIGKSKVAAGGVNRNQIFFGNFKVKPFDPFYFGIEYEYLRTGYMGNGTSAASVIMTNFVYNF